MKYDEFAFFNQQLAAMLRDGIPLEGALRRLCQEMRRGKLRDELQTLEADLAKGVPMADALKPRQLPELYKRMILVGVKSGDLPGALTMLADYFQRQNNVWTRLKSMMTYPLIVMFVAFLISTVLAFIWTHVIGPSMENVFGGMGMSFPEPHFLRSRPCKPSGFFRWCSAFCFCSRRRSFFCRGCAENFSGGCPRSRKPPFRASRRR